MAFFRCCIRAEAHVHAGYVSSISPADGLLSVTELRAIDSGSPLKSIARAAYEYSATYGSLLIFALLCLGWSMLAIPLHALLPSGLGRRLGRRGIMAVFRLYAHWLEFVGVYRFDLGALDAIPRSAPLILAPNHPSLIDAVLVAGRHATVSCIMKSELMENILLGPGARLARYIRNGSPRQMVREAVADLRDGGTLLLFPEGTRSARSPIGPLSKSVGVIARRAGVAVQTLLIETDSNYLGKGSSPWARTSLPIAYRIRLGRRFEPPADAAAFSLELERYFRSELQQDT
jgi:1-acyl-sn-glycerol-3-phosphate acyltransferase